MRYLFVLMLLGILGLILTSCAPEHKEDVVHIPAPLPIVDELHTSLQEYSLKVMEVCGTKISPMRQSAIATSIEVVVPWYIKDRADQEMFVMLICIESRFDNRAKSPVGAVGLAQLMPKYAQNFADLCNLGKLEAGDIEDPTINISLGACFFSSLRKELKSSILAVAAYNAGPASSSVRNLAMLGNPVHETASYVAKAEMLKEKMKGAKDTMKGAKEQMDDGQAKGSTEQNSTSKQDSDKREVPNGKGEGVPNQRGAGEEHSGAPTPSQQPAG